jgi:hypothetical protein
MTTEAWEQVDWDAAVRRERRRDAVAVLPVIGWAAGVVLLCRNWVSPDRALTVALLVGAALGLLGLLVTVGVRSVRPDGYRMNYAIRELVDPGPGLRRRTDHLAEKRSWRSYRWAIPSYALSLFARGRWDVPELAVPGAVLLLISGATVVFWAERFAKAADRWLADPPGPSREPEPPSRWPAQRQLTVFAVGAGVLLAVLFVVALVVG